MNKPTRLTTRLAHLVLSIALVASSVTCAPLAGAQSTEANITRLTASILARSQFAHNPLDRDLAGQFLNRYLDSLDGRRSLFLETDVREFTRVEPDLARATVGAGSTKLAHVIWKRFVERSEQNNKYVQALLAKAEPTFETKETFQLDRKDAERPKDLAAAQTLWKQRMYAEYLDQKLGGAPREQIVKSLKRQYELQLRTVRAMQTQEVTSMYLDALASVYDPHSEYLGRDQLQSFEMAMNLSLFGIGAGLEMRDGFCTIREVLPGGPASRSVLKPGDRIIAVAQDKQEPTDITSLPLSRAVQLIRGPKGSKVTLTILPASAAQGGGQALVSLVRDEVKLEDQEAKAWVVDLPGQGSAEALRVGVLDLPSFYASTDRSSGGARSITADVTLLLKKLKAEKIRGLLLDLRGNGGGSLEEAIRLTGLFIPKGPVVQTRDAAGEVEVESDKDPTELYTGPLVVLTSRMSASASEILAGALQDYGRAVIVGDSSTFGKGTVQSLLPLAPIMEENDLKFDFDPGALKVTIRKFYRPSGGSTQLRGIASDIVIPSLTDISEISESALDNPLPWDTIRPAPFEVRQRVKPYLETLRSRSAQRLAAEKSFSLIQANLAEVRQRTTEKRVSLNEAERKAERTEQDERQRGLEAWWKARATSAEKAHEVRLKSLAAPLTAAKPFASMDDEDLSDLPKGDDGKPELSSIASAAASDVVLDEAVEILADYVRVLTTPAPTSTPAPATKPKKPGPA